MTDDEVASIAEAATGRSLAVSRAASPDLIARLQPADLVPITGGRTVWDAAPGDAFLVVETPNHLGVAEYMPSRDHHLHTVASTHPLRTVERFHRRLITVRGISQYHDVAASWFTVLASEPDVLLVVRGQVTVTVLGERYPDIPGGVRLGFDPDVTVADLDRYAAAVEREVGG